METVRSVHLYCVGPPKTTGLKGLWLASERLRSQFPVRHKVNGAIINEGVVVGHLKPRHRIFIEPTNSDAAAR